MTGGDERGGHGHPRAGRQRAARRRNVELAAMLANLTARGIGRLFAEGGAMIHTHLTSRRSDLVQYLKSR
jgi:riboflavin biosynthesis pyrimidine reductase